MEGELASLRRATEKASTHLQRASRDVGGRMTALERMVERGLTSEELWSRLEGVAQELEILRRTSEIELAKLRRSSEREFSALLSVSGRIARIMLSGRGRRRAPRTGAALKPAAKWPPTRGAAKVKRIGAATAAAATR